MLARSVLLVVEIVSVIAYVVDGYATTNPYFICQSPEANQSYTVTMSRREEIVVVNCTRRRVNEIIARLNETTLRDRPIRLRMSAQTLDEIRLPQNVTNLDLSGNTLTGARLESFVRLRKLNLTSNRISSLRAIELRRNLVLASLDVSRNRLLQLEQSSIPPAKRLFLTANNIFDLDRNLTLPPPLRLLDLTRNEIENISAVSIASTSLATLNLSVNLISAVSATTFERLSALETLVLECNKIFEIEPGTFHGNRKLVELNLRDNNLSALRSGVFDELVNLQILDISKNDLLKLTPDAVQNLNLIDFSVSENAKLCDAECKHDMEFLLVLGGRLRALKMDRLRLRRFPVMLTTSVRRLDLSENELDAVQLGNLENFPFLEALTLSGNDIEMVENDVFARMEFLAVLCLDNNKLKRVPTILPQSLEVLHLHRNRITSIGVNDFNGLTNLKTLKLNSNLIEAVESDSFRFLVNLVTLDVSDNPLKILSTDAFEGPNKLQILHAADLQIVRINVTDVRYFPISELPNLRTLNLSRSPEMVKSFLTDLPLLATVKQLEILDLGYANLTRVPAYLENFLPRLRRLRLAGNPLNCTKTWWLEWRQSYATEADAETTGETGLSIRVTPTDVKPLGDNVVVDSECPNVPSPLKTIPEHVFWASVNTFATNHSQQDARYENFTTYLNSKRKWSDSAPSIGWPFASTNVTGARFTPAKRKKVSSRSLPETTGERQTLARASDTTPKSDDEIRAAKPDFANESISRDYDDNVGRNAFSSANDGAAAEGRAAARTTQTPPFEFAARRHTRNVTLRAESLAVDTTTAARRTSNAVSSSTVYNSVAERPQLDDRRAQPSNESHDRISFFDWFPSHYNETFASIEQTAATMDDQIEYTHPGVVIFSAITCFLSVIFLTLVAPSCVQKYKWNRHNRYNSAEFDDDYQHSIEISSVSAFVETELSVSLA